MAGEVDAGTIAPSDDNGNESEKKNGGYEDEMTRISVSKRTRRRMYFLAGPERTYEDVIAALLDIASEDLEQLWWAESNGEAE